eukprot:3973300-Pleurochrysis_carterae.AAC.1
MMLVSNSRAAGWPCLAYHRNSQLTSYIQTYRSSWLNGCTIGIVRTDECMDRRTSSKPSIGKTFLYTTSLLGKR